MELIVYFQIITNIPINTNTTPINNLGVMGSFKNNKERRVVIMMLPLSIADTYDTLPNCKAL